ncbi:hypothetical protein ACFOD9_06295 [Novosphingobium bradum]|uniref:Uncharacterized protein n=1 Tax=Novosphingobium bradum TaxID=1737444 RepID=A0ABV7IPH2_9SPHN
MALHSRSPASTADGHRDVRLRRREPQPAAIRLPHPSWRRAVGGLPETGAQRLSSASEFWDRLGI